MDEFKVQISGAVLDEKIDLSIRNQLADIKGLAINVDQVSLGSSAIKNIKDTLAKNKVDLQLSLGNINNIKSQIQQATNQVSSALSSGLKPFSELKIGTSIDAVVDRNDIVNVEKSLEKIKNIYSEFGKVKITNEIFDHNGNIEKFKINIEQVNGDLKETRSFLMALNDKSFIFPDDIIKGAESYVKHLNSAKDVINKTGEALNQEKTRLKEQENYYKKQAQAIKDVWNLKTKLLSSQDLETVELEKQLKAATERVKYNVKQIDSKDLGDNTLDRKNNDLEYRLKKQYELNAAIKQDIELRKQLASTDKINYGIDVGNYETKLVQAVNQMNRFKVTTSESENSILQLKNAYDNLLNSKEDKRLDAEKAFNKQLKITENQIKQLSLDANNILADPTKIQKLSNHVQDFYNKNTASHLNWGNQLTSMMQKLGSASDMTEKELADIRKEYENIAVEARTAGKLGLSFTDSIKAQAGKFSQWVSVSGIIMTIASQLRNIPKAVYEIDAAMTNLYKVTDETNIKYTEFLNNAGKSAQEVGRSVSSLVEQTSNWAKLGYTLDESVNLAKISSIYANVGEVDNNTAVSDMVTAMKAFNIEASNSINIIDSLNKLGNEFATDAASLGEGLSNSASAMALGGSSLEKTLALLTGGAEITQQAGELGNALKVGQMRVMGMKGALEELGEEYDNIESVSKIQTHILNLTKGQVNIMNDADPTKFKEYYDILEDVSKVYNSLDQTDQADILETLFGKQRGNQGSALIQAFQSGQIQKALEAASNAEGSAMQEQERWMSSLEAKTQQFEAAFQSLSDTVLDSSLLKGIIDFGTQATNIFSAITDKVGVLSPLIGALGAKIISLSGLDYAY